MSNIVVAGAAGRMGRQLVAAILERDDVQLAGATERPDSAHVGTDAGLLVGNEPLGIEIVSGIESVESSFDTIIDFTAPVSTRALLSFAADNNKRMIIGTTGLDDNDQQAIKDTAAATAVVFAANAWAGV